MIRKNLFLTQFALCSLIAHTSCRNNLNVDAKQNSLAASTPNPIPSGLAVDKVSAEGIVISWQPVTNAELYNVYREAIVIGTTSSTSFVDQNIKNGTNYAYKIGAIIDGKEFVATDVVSATTLAPSVTNLSTRVNDHDVSLSWKAQAGAVSYKVRRAESSGTFVDVGMVSPSSYSDTTIKQATTYRYEVTVVYSAIESEASEIISCDTLKLAVSGLTASEGNSQITLAWTAITNAAGYAIYRSTASGVYSTILTTVTANSYVDATVTNGTTYTYSVQTIYAAGSSPNSVEVIAIPLGIPGAVGVLAAETARDSATALNWTLPTRGGPAKTLKIFRATTTGVSGTSVVIATVPATQTSYSDTLLTNGTTYFYAIVASNNQGDSALSNEASATPWSPTAPVSTANIFVKASASAGGDGSYAAPFQTLVAGFTAVNTGGRIVVLDGTYSLSSTITVNKSVEFRSKTDSYLYSNVILNGNAINFAAFTTSATDITIKGLQFTNFGGGVNQAAIRTLDGSHNLKVIGNHFYTTQGPGISSNSGTVVSGMIIEHNLIENLTGATISGLFMNALTGCSISYNEIANTTYAGIQIQSVVNCTVKGNYLHNLPTHGINLTTASGNVTLTENIIDTVNTSHAADSGGIRTYATALVGPVTITGNKVTNTANAFSLRNGEDLTGKTITIHNNHFASSFGNGAYHGGIGTLDVTQNYWGSLLGPYQATSNPNGVMSAFLDDTKLITFQPFLTKSPFY